MIEDYFPFGSRDERSPITFNTSSPTDTGDYISVTAADGVLVEGRAKGGLFGFVRELTLSRGYSIRGVLAQLSEERIRELAVREKMNPEQIGRILSSVD